MDGSHLLHGGWGPHGLEDLIHQCGYGMAVVVVLLTPLVWSVRNVLLYLAMKRLRHGQAGAHG